MAARRCQPTESPTLAQPTLHPARRDHPGAPVSSHWPKPSTSPVSAEVPLSALLGQVYCQLIPFPAGSQTQLLQTTNVIITRQFRLDSGLGEISRAWLSHQASNGSPATLNSDKRRERLPGRATARSFPAGPGRTRRASGKDLGPITLGQGGADSDICVCNDSVRQGARKGTP